MNYIFLDIDGVLNYNDFVFEYIDDDDKIVDLNNVEILSYIVSKTDAKIVLSSSWRYGYDDNFIPTYTNGACQKLLDIFKEHGLQLYDRTKVVGDYDNGYRPGQIEEYIDKYLTDKDNFIIFDDETWGDEDPEGMEAFGKHFIRTDWYKKGLSSDDGVKAIRILNSQEYSVKEWKDTRRKQYEI